MKQRGKELYIAAIGLLILFGLSACATIPKESADLSIELGKRISAIEDAHMVLVDKYFDEKRNRIDEFVEKEWVPEFAVQFFANQQISNMWNQIVSSGNTADRLQFIITLGPKLQTKINAKRLELIKPLDDAEQLIKQQLRDNYDHARAINNSVTSFLVSAVKVKENQNRYLEMVGVKEEKVAEVIDQIDSAVEELHGKCEQVVEKGKMRLPMMRRKRRMINWQDRFLR
jgi:hypothetical protein